MTADRLGTIDLPELPEAFGDIRTRRLPVAGYTAAQMKEYARAAIAALTPAAAETEQSIKADAYDMIAEALERAGLAGSSIVESVERLISAPTPPPADAVRALVGEWREEANEPRFPAEEDRDAVEAFDKAMNRCADELDAALAGEWIELPACVRRDVPDYGTPAAAPTPESLRGMVRAANLPTWLGWIGVKLTTEQSDTIAGWGSHTGAPHD